jgi:hypothetical protein
MRNDPDFAANHGRSLGRRSRGRRDNSPTGEVWEVTGEGIAVRERGGGRSFVAGSSVTGITAFGGDAGLVVTVSMRSERPVTRSFRLRREPRISMSITLYADGSECEACLAALESVLAVPVRRRRGWLDEE